jgi:hypothetical protein
LHKCSERQAVDDVTRFAPAPFSFQAEADNARKKGQKKGAKTARAADGKTRRKACKFTVKSGPGL